MKIKSKLLIAAFMLGSILMPDPTLAQRGGVKTDSRMLYHNGPVMDGTSTAYLIWYGNWSTSPPPQAALVELTIALGGSPYFLINTTYPNAIGNAPNGNLLYGGSIGHDYSYGTSLTVEEIRLMIDSLIQGGSLPLDGAGIYIVIGSSDVYDVQPDGSSFCTPGRPPHHGTGEFYPGFAYKYGYLGAANRCPTIAAPQFFGGSGSLLPTPNADYVTDAMANTYVRLLNAIVTNPQGTSAPYSGWYDRYGLENSDKCVGRFGTTYTLPNGARANVQLGARHFLIQENWINDRKGRCSLSLF